LVKTACVNNFSGFLRFIDSFSVRLRRILRISKKMSFVTPKRHDLLLEYVIELRNRSICAIQKYLQTKLKIKKHIIIVQ